MKVATLNGFLVCTCLERYSTGIPCAHECSIAMKEAIPIIIADRWFYKYSEVLSELSDAERINRVDSFIENNTLEL